MGLSNETVGKLRGNSLAAFKKMLGRGASACTVYPSEGNVQRNLYHDIVSDIDTATAQGYEWYICVVRQPQVKVAKALGWYREDAELPMLGYMPHSPDWSPTDGTLVVVPASEGMAAGRYRVKKAAMHGQGEACSWVTNLVPDRVGI